MAPETIAELSRHPRIIGIKEAGTDLDRISRAILLSEPDFVFYSGNDSLALPLFALGAKGLISVASILLPAEFGALCRFCLDGRYSEAARLHYRYFPLMDALFCEVNPIPVKTASSLMGLCTSDIRLPLIGPSDAHRDLIQARLMEVGLI